MDIFHVNDSWLWGKMRSLRKVAACFSNLIFRGYGGCSLEDEIKIFWKYRWWEFGLNNYGRYVDRRTHVYF